MLSDALNNYPNVLTDDQKTMLASVVVEGDPAAALDTIENIVQLACCVEYALKRHVVIKESGGELEFVVAPRTGQAVRANLHAALEAARGKD